MLASFAAVSKRELESQGKELLHQQLYVIGRDIASKHGNLLTEYGCHREPSPIPGIPSLYSSIWNRRSRLSLRGFGVFIGDDSIGGIFIHRYTFEPRWMPSSRFEPVAWLPKEMPRTRRPRGWLEQQHAVRMVSWMIHWFIDYEAWIADRLGSHYRIGQLTHFPAEKHELIHWHLRDDWLAVHQMMQPDG